MANGTRYEAEGKAERYRARAAQVRSLIGDVKRRETRQLLEEIAREWEQLADTVSRASTENA